jgi:hypothetical protein
MQCNQRSTVPAILMAAALAVAPAASSAVPADNSGRSAAIELSSTLDKVDRVSFYFLSRTGEYSFRGQRFKDESAVRIHRSCGANCRMFMKAVTEHLQAATASNCAHGQQNVLVEAGGLTSITYSHSGRMIEVDGKCYFSPKSINDIIRSESFIFG